MTFALMVDNDFRAALGSSRPSADSYRFPCSVIWWRYDDDGNKVPFDPGAPAADPRSLSLASWTRGCVVGHNQVGDEPQAQLGFVAEAIWCDDGNPLCYPKYAVNAITSSEPPDGYRIWPAGSYQVDFYIDVAAPATSDSPVASRRFVIEETERPDPWPLTVTPDRPIDGYRPPTDYTNPGNFSPWYDPRFTCAEDGGYASCNRTTYSVDRLPYAPTTDCVAAGLCSESYPWENPLPWGAGQRSYEIRPLWGDYNHHIDTLPTNPPPYLGPDYQTAPYPFRHPGFDFIYPHCPRLDWCYTEPGAARTDRLDPHDEYDRTIVDDSVYGSYTGGYKTYAPLQDGGDPCEADRQECDPTY